jgi:serine phosphatase RsbU (regulator of sigma subunit)
MKTATEVGGDYYDFQVEKNGGLTVVIGDATGHGINARMPPLLIHRAAINRVEEITLKAMPLGSVAEYAYQKREVALSPGDTVMLMSDGFPELFNQQREIFDYDRAKGVFAEAAPHSPNRIIEHFVRVGESWANGKGQHDDMTFIVMKVK